MNIVLADKDSEKDLYNAPLIITKYGLSAEVLTNSAWRCQEKYNVYEHETIVNTWAKYHLIEVSPVSFLIDRFALSFCIVHIHMT